MTTVTQPTDQTTTTTDKPFPFHLPKSESFKLRDADFKSIITRAKELAAKAKDTPVQALMEMTRDAWAWHVLTDELTKAGKKRILDAIFRYDVAMLELARQEAVDNSAYTDWVAVLDDNLVSALETPLNMASIDSQHRRDVVSGLQSLIHLEKEDRGMQSKPNGNRRGGKKRRARRTGATTNS